MSPERRRSVWRVEHPNGELEFLNYWRSARHAAVMRAPGDATIHLTRLARGRYYYVTTWSTPAGPRAGIVHVLRVTQRAADRATTSEPLDFEHAAAVALQKADRDGL